MVPMSSAESLALNPIERGFSAHNTLHALILRRLALDALVAGHDPGTAALLEDGRVAG